MMVAIGPNRSQLQADRTAIGTHKSRLTRKGVAWIAFDSYRNGDYDIFLTSVTDNKVGELRPITSSKFYEAHPSVACTSDGKVWLAWEQGGFNWGKDQGHWLNITGKQRGTTLGSTRSVKTAAVDTETGKVLAGPAIDQRLDQVEPKVTAMAGLAADGQGRLWMRFRKVNRGRRRTRAISTLLDRKCHVLDRGRMVGGSTGSLQCGAN